VTTEDHERIRLDNRALENLARLAGTYDVPVGSTLKHSRYLRTYCSECGEAMRVIAPTRSNRCERCIPGRLRALGGSDVRTRKGPAQARST